MSEQQSATAEPSKDGQPTSEPTSGAGDESKQITMTPKQLAERLQRAMPADYDALKARSARLDEIEQANKTEAERLVEARAAAEHERDEARAEALRLRIATKHGINDEDADLFLTGKDEQTLTRQAQRLAGRDADRKTQGNRAPNEGATSSTAAGSGEREFVTELFGG